MYIYDRDRSACGMSGCKTNTHALVIVFCHLHRAGNCKYYDQKF